MQTTTERSQEDIEIIFQGTCRNLRSVVDGKPCVSYFTPGKGNTVCPISELPEKVFNRRLSMLKSKD